MKVCSVCRRCFDDAADSCTERDHPFLTGSRKGHLKMVPGYSLEELLSSGIKVDTYRAHRLDCGRLCQVKIISGDSEIGELFLRDAGNAAAFSHPGVADIYETGSLGSGEYFVVSGDDSEPTLRTHLDSAGSPDLLTSIRIVEQVAEALHALHQKGIVHGAVSLDNITISQADEGDPVVTLRNIDLGGLVAKNVLSNKFLIDSAIDLIRYFSPEHCSGDPVTPRSDVYSLGVVFYELLAGTPPFVSARASVLMDMHRSHRAAEVTIDDFELRMLVTHSLSEALQKQPDFRQATAAAFARQMRHIEQLATHVSTPPPVMHVPGSRPVAVSAAPAATPEPIPIFQKEEIEQPEQVFSEAVLSPEFVPEPGSAFLAAETVSQYEAAPIETEAAPAIEFEPAGQAAISESISFMPGTVFELDLPVHESDSTVSERSALNEHRLRLKLWKKQTISLDSSGGTETASNDKPIEATHATAAPPPSPVTFALTQEPGEEHRHFVGPLQAEADDCASPLGRPQTVRFFETSSLTEPMPSPSTYRFIKWDLLEDDIPSIEAVLEARSESPACANESEIDIPASNSPTIEALPVVQVPPDRVIDPTKDIVETPATAAITHAAAMPTGSDNVAAAAPPQKQIAFDLAGSSVIQNAAPKLAFSSNFSGGSVFVPTILGEKSDRRIPRQRFHGSILSIDDEAAPPPSSIPYRSLAIGAAVIVIAALFAFGNDHVRGYFDNSQPETSFAAASVPAAPVPIPPQPEPLTTAPSISSPEEIRPVRSFRDTAPDSTAVTRPRPAAQGPQAKIEAGPPQASAPKPTESNPLTPSTIVITYGNGKEKLPAGTKATDKRSHAAPDKGAGATRPRIVANPHR